MIGSLVRWHLQAKLNNLPLDTQFVSTQAPQEPHREAVNMQEIVGLVETTFGVSRTELISKSRKGKVNWARQVAMYLARMHTLLPLEEIGKTFGRDHATVIYAFQRVQESIAEQPTKRYEVEFLRRKLQARTPRALQR
jgi:chromosomal replication initiator protein